MFGVNLPIAFCQLQGKFRHHFAQSKISDGQMQPFAARLGT
jgi:hypothetical protein